MKVHLRHLNPIVLLVPTILPARTLDTPQVNWRARLFAVLNLLAVFAIWHRGLPDGLGFFFVYLAFVGLQFAFTKKFSRAPGALPWIAFSLPILTLVLVRYADGLWVPTSSWLDTPAHRGEISIYFIGISYMSFRLSHLILEVRNGVAPMPTFAQFLAYGFFVPTMAVGPISPWGRFHRSLTRPEVGVTPPARALLRIAVGAGKFIFLAHLVSKVSFSAILLDGHPHTWVDYCVGAFAYYVYIYLNFSGFCDIAIGGAALLGIEVAENFNRPLAARSVRDFWNRWHITLSTWMRDVVFAPLSKVLVARMGPRAQSHAVPVVIFLVFTLVGVWHGVGWYFFFFGMLHAMGVVTNHYYGMMLKRVLGREGCRAYMNSSPIRWAAVGITQTYVSMTFYFFWKGTL